MSDKTEDDATMESPDLLTAVTSLENAYDVLRSGAYAVVLVPFTEARNMLREDSDRELRAASNSIAFAVKILGEKDHSGLSFLGRLFLAHGHAKLMAKFWQEQHAHLLAQIQPIVERAVQSWVDRFNRIQSVKP